eukprot:TRINITY_DN2343_c0_g1_i1.p1 TRINITY_DN2343_c0_g1~~TRINITY_DN2343_c0_g1_i1.p1  ORF type:complete len:152 (-),score=27.50 TRINITY_DN2343_c0_g1_i1:81-536(-)
MNSSTLLFLVVALFAVSAVSTGGFVWKYCSTSVKYPVTINQIVLSPNPPQVGKVCKAHFDGNLTYPNSIKSATTVMKISGYIGGKWTTLPPFENDVCDKLTCPIKPGPIVYDYSLTIPVITPKADYMGSLTATDDANDKLLLCLNFTVSLV